MSPLSWIRSLFARPSRIPHKTPSRRPVLEGLEDRCLLSLCQPGYWSPTGEQPGVAATPGYYVPTEGATSQTPAPLGSYVGTSGAIVPTPALPGSYVDTLGAITAKLAPLGSYVATSGAIVPTPALPGSYVDTFGATFAKLAPTGYFVPGAGAAQPTPADPGYYVPTMGATREIRDPRGTYSAVAAATYSRINPAPIVDSLAAQVGNEGDSVRLPVQAIDVPEDRLTYRARNLPAGLAINPSTGLIYGILGSHAARATPYSVTIRVSDGHKLSMQSFTWTVHDTTAPVLDPPGSQTSGEGDVVRLALHASDADHDRLTYGATGLPPGLRVNPRTGVISGRLGRQAAGNFTVTVTASDGLLSDSSTFAWTVQDVLP